MIAFAPRKRVPRLTRLGLVLAALLVALSVGGLLAATGARADDQERYTPSARGTRPAVARWRPLLERYDWDVDTALRVIDCESGGDPDVWNRQGSGAHGLFQLLGWEAVAYDLYGVWDVADPAINTHVAYLLYLAGGRRFGTRIGWISSVGCWS